MTKALALGFVLMLNVGSSFAEPLIIGSKRFTESYILGEIVRQSIERAGAEAEHKSGLGNTGILYSALKSGSIHVYPEYTGTIAREVLKLDHNPTSDELNRMLAKEGLAVGVPLGFNNTYALAMRDDVAAKLGITKVSDLARHPDVKLGLSQEFIGRADGWPGLKAAYGLPHATPSGLDHGLAYEALAAGRIDVIDIYSTDAKIARYRLRVLEDDRAYFPKYDAVLLYRADVPARFPEAWRAAQRLERSIDAPRMIAMNAAAELEGQSFADAARSFFGEPAVPAARRNLWRALFGDDFWRLTGEHLVLTFVSLGLAIVASVPLGVLAAREPRASQLVLGTVGVIQTIPSLALLAFLIALFGRIGVAPALFALFLYALLPIVRNTHTGLTGIRNGLAQAALALGLTPWQRLIHIELPLAWPTILAGIKTSAVINVGTATIAAFIGAGGYGERIAQGLALNDTTTLLAGAIPAAALAIIVQFGFEWWDRRLIWTRFR